MNTNSQNPQVGRDFQSLVKVLAEEHYKTKFLDKKAVLVGYPPKEHRFDLVSVDSKIVT